MPPYCLWTQLKHQPFPGSLAMSADFRLASLCNSMSQFPNNGNVSLLIGSV